MPVPILPSPVRPAPTMDGDQRWHTFAKQQQMLGRNPRDVAGFLAQGGTLGAGGQAPTFGQQATLTPFTGQQQTYQGPYGPGGGNATGRMNQPLTQIPQFSLPAAAGQVPPSTSPGGGSVRSSVPTGVQGQLDIYGRPTGRSQQAAAGGAQPSGAASPLGGATIRTGIDVKPAIDPNWLTSATAGLENYSPQAPSPGMSERLLELINNQTGPMAMGFRRQGEYDNAQHLLGAQQARSQAGLGWGGIQAGDELNALTRGTSVLNAIINMLMASINAVPG